MTAVFALACDATVPSGAAGWATHSGHPCPTISRPARSDVVLRTLAGRDGWLLDGSRHLCPTHAAAAARAAS